MQRRADRGIPPLSLPNCMALAEAHNHPIYQFPVERRANMYKAHNSVWHINKCSIITVILVTAWKWCINLRLCLHTTSIRHKTTQRHNCWGRGIKLSSFNCDFFHSCDSGTISSKPEASITTWQRGFLKRGWADQHPLLPSSDLGHWSWRLRPLWSLGWESRSPWLAGSLFLRSLAGLAVP